MSSTRFQPAIFPDLPRSSKVIEKSPNGQFGLTAEWALFFQQLVQALQTNLTPEGFVFPQQTTTNIAVLTATTSIANILYNSTIDAFQGNIANLANLDANGNPIQEWDSFAMIVNHAGNPNNNVAGFLNKLCLDTTHNVLYICTSAGSASTATWTSV